MRRQSLHGYSIRRRSQLPSGRERERERGDIPASVETLEWVRRGVRREGVGGGDQGVCKEDVSRRLEGLSFRIRIDFLPALDPVWNSLLQLALLFITCMLSCFCAELQFDVFLSVCVTGLLNRQGRTSRTTRPLAGVKVHHGRWPKGPPVHCAVSQPVPAHQLLV